MVDLSKPGYQTIAHGMSGQFVDIADLVGSRFGDILCGSAGDNAITAGDGNDLIKASPGVDVIDGGAGVDTLSYENATGGITISLARAANQATGYGAVTIRGVENLTGGKYADLIAGDAGDNLLNGGAGTDTVSYADAAAGVTVSLALATAQATGGAGTDTLINFENLAGSAFADVLTGSGGDNVLFAGAGDDLIFGTAGKDQIDGGAGSDTLSFDPVGLGVMLDLAQADWQTVAHGLSYKIAGVENVTGSRFGDSLSGTAGDNVILAGAGNDVLDGRGGNDRLDGGEGNDRLVGGAGVDSLRGGGGGDTFVFRAAAESKASAPDRILDFTSGDGDRIDLRQIDANSMTAADDAFILVNAFTKHAGELTCKAYEGGMLVQGDVDGDGLADFAIQLLGVSRLMAADLIL